MASTNDPDFWLKIGGYAFSAVAYGAGLIVYVRMQLKAHSDSISEHTAAINEIKRTQALGVRPEDLKLVREDIRELRKAVLDAMKSAKHQE